MNKAFVREPDRTAEFCPRCGAKGEPVGTVTLRAHLTDDQRGRISDPAEFCPSPQCPVAYFDAFERLILAAELAQPVYPKDPHAPLCACFGLTQADVEQDVREGVVTRTRAVVEKSKLPGARCTELAANGRPCIAYVQKCYMQCRSRQ